MSLLILIISICCIGELVVGELEIIGPPRPPRIYTRAPTGVTVSQLRAIVGNDTDCDPEYSLISNEFSIDECHGIIKTAGEIDKSIGHFYNITVAIKSSDNETEFVDLSIEVTEYNEKGPSLTHHHYSQEILDVAPVGTTLMVLNGSDGDISTGRSNKLYYYIQDPQNSGKNPWLYPSIEPLMINYTSGEIKVSSVLTNFNESVLLYIGVADGGSPQRSQTSKLTLYIRSMSAAQKLMVESTSENSIKICWSPPILGWPDGYRISFNPRGAAQGINGQKVLNVTVEDIFESGNMYRGVGANKVKIRGEFEKKNSENLTLCAQQYHLKTFTFYIIKITGWSANGKMSMTSFPLTAITKKQDCSKELCNNGICQEKRSSPGYTCICKEGYTGKRCQTYDPCAARGITCANGKCQALKGKKAYCRCNEGYTGESCQEQTGSRSLKEKATYCQKSVTEFKFGRISWPKTNVGEEARIKCFGRIEQNSNSEAGQIETIGSLRSRKRFLESGKYVAIRKCLDGFNGPSWANPDASNCVEMYSEEQVSSSSSEEEDENSLFDFMKHSHSESAVKKYLHDSVDNISGVVKKRMTKNRANSAAKFLSDILEVDHNLIRQAYRDHKEGLRKIFTAIKDCARNVQLKVGETYDIIQKHFALTAKYLRKQDILNEISFIPSAESSTDPNLWFKIPKTALDTIPDENVRFQFISFIDDRIFDGNGSSLNMPVISATVGNSSLKNLNPPISYIISTNISQNSGAKCVFWDENTFEWLTDGVSSEIVDDSLICTSTHLTSFSVLLDPVAAPIEHSKALSVITYIGLAFSTVALIITIATFILFRSLRRDKAGMIVVNLSSALLLLNVSFIFATTVSNNVGLCVFFAVLLHYSVISAFAWMLIEALNMHQLLVTVFPSVETHFSLKRLFFGWVIPLLFVCVALSWNVNAYMSEGTDFCLISARNLPAIYYVTYLVPICIVLCINCVVFVLVMRVLMQRRPSSVRHKDPAEKKSIKKSPVTVAQIRGAITVVALLGVTWVAGALAVGALRTVFQYLFCITTPLQGLIIFIVRVLQNPDARNCWYYFLVHGKITKHKGQLSSLRTHSSSQNNSSMQTQSTGVTPPRSVLASALRAARKLSFGTVSNSQKKNEKRRYSSPNIDKNISPIERIYSRLNSHSPTRKSAMEQDNGVVKSDAPINDNIANGDIPFCDEDTNSHISPLPSPRPLTYYSKNEKRESFFIPELEIRPRSISNDLSTEIFSSIKSLQTTKIKKDILIPKNLDEKEKQKIINDVVMKTLEEHLPKNTSLTTDDVNETKFNSINKSNISKNLKATSLHHLVGCNEDDLKWPNSTLIRFASDITLNKNKGNDYTPLLLPNGQSIGDLRFNPD